MIRETQFGKVQGTIEENVEVYYGIPYGKEPVKDLKWHVPVDAECWLDVKDCSKKEEWALQISTVRSDDGSSYDEMVGTTDCLNLDVYTKEEFEKVPVLVFVHGGNNQTSHSFEIPGHDIVNRNRVVYVSVNYRLGLLGFNNLPALCEESKTGNFAFLDLAKSLEWVRKNIQNFGGDPNNVTISGFSAGGRDVMAMLVSPTFKGLFDKAIVYSGGMTIADEKASQEKIAKTMAHLVVEDGVCSNEEEAKIFLLQKSEETKNYLFGLDPKRIIQLFPKAAIRMARFPHLFSDGITLPKEGFDNATYVNDVPILMVTGSEEFSMFGLFEPVVQTMKDVEGAKRFIIQHGGEFYRNFNTQLSANQMRSYKSNMYLCQINYGDAQSEYTIPMFGSFHGVFVPLLTSQTNYGSLYDFSKPAYQDCAKFFNESIRTFMYQGNPGPLWKPWTHEEKNTLILDGKDGKAQIKIQDVFKDNAQIIQEMIEDPLNEEDKKTVISEILNGRWFSADLDAYFNNKSLW